MKAIPIIIIVAAAALTIWALYTGGTAGTHHPHQFERSEVLNLRQAINTYYLEYGKLPAQGTTRGDTIVQARGELLALLLGENVSNLNPRKKVFFEAKRARDGKRGLHTPPGEPYSELRDGEGRPFIIVMDTDYDTEALDPRTGNRIRTTALIYSLGKRVDRLSDDICSWDQGRQSDEPDA